MSPRRRVDPQPVPESRLKAFVLSLLRVAVTVAALVALGLIGYDAYRYLTTSNRFALAELVVTGCDDVRSAEVLRQARIQIGQNIWSVSGASTAERIQRIPWIREARVERILPDRVTITVSERVPVAKMEHPQLGWVGMDGAGILMPLRDSEIAGLPALEGLDQGVFRFGARVGPECNDQLLALLARVQEEGPETVRRFPALSVESDGDVLFRDLPFAAEIRLGREDLVRRWRDLSERLPRMLALSPRYRYIDLRFPGQGMVARPETYEPLRWLQLARRTAPAGSEPVWRTEMAESSR